MEIIIIFGLVFIGVPIGIGVLIYVIPKKLGYPKTAFYLRNGYCILVLVVVFYLLFQDQFFTQNDARKLVEEQHIKLNDKFELSGNWTSSAIGDYYHTFTLKISAHDKKEAILAIQSSKFFKRSKSEIDSMLYMRPERYFGPRVLQDYETGYSFVREYFQPSGKQGYAPTFRRVSISKSKDELVFEDIVE